MSLKDLQNLEGRVALVTGGSRGLGLQMAEVLGELGATVVITARKKHELEDAAATLTKQSVKVETVVNDLQDSGSVQPLVEGILERHGQIDVVINNAGAAWGEKAEDHSLEAWEKVINLNLTAPFLLSQMVGKLSMIPRRSGRIINIASIAGLVGTEPGFMPTIAYNSSKGGIVNFTRSLAAEWAQHNITVNAIAPGVFPSKMSAGMIDRAEEHIMNQTPMRKYGGSEDLKGVTALLASDASGFITGQIIAVDGGYVSV
ncbi:MAG: SDR family oxidoreductase [Burkholderiales bacterium]|jgi:gluconate 5-dehydrogenase|nr:SDR family oxidoreductase [Betaproteobacteria bacterium]MBT6529800.1 SDR family oxidoreductase [Betaproteobacteria bacterium]MDG1162059.1 SDR family oxidoreductase [Burkholderiales bacterium]MDG1225066.1 SDR family oxidoreductase [Burkholderiales bacterium]MDG2202497.1 SDR family oxidoreductase [Burkholderiales bacterium]|tara:strand:+ start:88 stop:864 length:777 start_codon:yes stop_codon:yes gene_type:complete